MTARALTRVEIIKTLISETLKQGEGIPSGHLYAMLMGVVDIDEYTQVIAELKQEGILQEKYHYLTRI